MNEYEIYAETSEERPPSVISPIEDTFWMGLDGWLEFNEMGEEV